VEVVVGGLEQDLAGLLKAVLWRNAEAAGDAGGEVEREEGFSGVGITDEVTLPRGMRFCQSHWISRSGQESRRMKGEGVVPGPSKGDVWSRLRRGEGMGSVRLVMTWLFI